MPAFRLLEVGGYSGLAFSLYAGLWFVFHAVIMAGISVARADPVDETQLSLIFVSIIAALAADDWNTGRLEREDEIETLEGILAGILGQAANADGMVPREVR
jgi:hypothetical protein